MAFFQNSLDLPSFIHKTCSEKKGNYSCSEFGS